MSPTASTATDWTKGNCNSCEHRDAQHHYHTLFGVLFIVLALLIGAAMLL